MPKAYEALTRVVKSSTCKNEIVREALNLIRQQADNVPHLEHQCSYLREKIKLIGRLSSNSQSILLSDETERAQLFLLNRPDKFYCVELCFKMNFSYAAYQKNTTEPLDHKCICFDSHKMAQLNSAHLVQNNEVIDADNGFEIYESMITSICCFEK